MGMLAPTIPAKVDFIGGTAFIIGLAVGAQGLGEAFFSIPTGFLINKFGNKKIMIIGMIGLALSGFLSGLFQNNQENSKIIRNIPICSGTFQNTPKYFKIFQNMQDFNKNTTKRVKVTGKEKSGS